MIIITVLVAAFIRDNLLGLFIAICVSFQLLLGYEADLCDSN